MTGIIEADIDAWVDEAEQRSDDHIKYDFRGVDKLDCDHDATGLSSFANALISAMDKQRKVYAPAIIPLTELEDADDHARVINEHIALALSQRYATEIQNETTR
jgi:hypothetical protein